MRKIYLILSFLAAVACAATAGLRLSPFLAVQLGYSPFRSVEIQGGDVLPGVIALINGASREIILTTEFLDNVTVLEALAAKFNGSCKLVIILPNTRENRPAIRWLEARGIKFTAVPKIIRGSEIVIDRQTVGITSSRIAGSAELAKETATLLIYQHEPTAQSAAKRLENLSNREGL